MLLVGQLKQYLAMIMKNLTFLLLLEPFLESWCFFACWFPCLFTCAIEDSRGKHPSTRREKVDFNNNCHAIQSNNMSLILIITSILVTYLLSHPHPPSPSPIYIYIPIPIPIPIPSHVSLSSPPFSSLITPNFPHALPSQAPPPLMHLHLHHAPTLLNLSHLSSAHIDYPSLYI